jgi:hypothetical protein
MPRLSVDVASKKHLAYSFACFYDIMDATIKSQECVALKILVLQAKYLKSRYIKTYLSPY